MNWPSFVCRANGKGKHKQFCLLLYLILIILPISGATNELDAPAAAAAASTEAAAAAAAAAGGSTIQPEVPNATNVQEQLLQQVGGAAVAGELAPSDAAQRQHLAPSAAAAGADADLDAPISASEILTNDNKPPLRRIVPTSSLFVGVAADNATSNSQQQQQQQQQSLDEPNDNNNISKTDNDQTDNDKQQFSQINYSRPIYRLMFVILFALASISLGALYMLKCCGCRRRKRLNLLQRNLVMDASLTPALLPSVSSSLGCLNRVPSGPQDFLQAECSCFNQQQQHQHQTSAIINSGNSNGGGGFIQNLLRSGNLWNPLNNGLSHLRPANQSHQQANSVPTTTALLYQQLALAERIAFHQLGASSTSHLASAQPVPGCRSCLINATGCESQLPAHRLNVDSLQCGFNVARPPAYSDLFQVDSGLAQAAGQPDTNLVPVQVVELNNQLQLNPNWDGQQPSASVSDTQTNNSSETASIGELHLQQQDQDRQQQQQQQKNLLVKLNLNKTKLLSADDLVLLSKLIDVPIVVQQQQQLQQPQVASGDAEGETADEELAREAHQIVACNSELETGSKMIARMHRSKTADMARVAAVYQVDEEEEEEEQQQQQEQQQEE